MLKDIEIRSITNEAFYERGLRYYRNGAVEKIEVEPDGSETIYRGRVRGNLDIYSVRAVIRGEQVEEWSCTCPAAEQYNDACKHVVAFLKKVQELQRREAAGRSTRVMKKETGLRLFSIFGEGKDVSPIRKDDEPLRIEPKLFVFREYGNVTNWLEFKVGRERLYVLRNIPEFMRTYDSGLPVEMGKQLTLEPAKLRFAPGLSEKLWHFLRRAYQDVASTEVYSSYFRSSYNNVSTMFEQKRCKLTPRLLREFLEIMRDTSFSAVLNGKKEQTVHIEDTAPEVRIRVDEAEGGARISLLEPDDMVLLDATGENVLIGNTIYRPEKDFAERLKAIEQAFLNSRTLRLNDEHMAGFFAEVLPKLEKAAHVEVDGVFSARYEMMPLAAEVYLDYFREGVSARLLFHYGDASFNPVTQEPPALSDGRHLIRDTETERKIRSIFDAFSFEQEGDRLVQPDEEPFYEFLEEGLPELSKLVDVYYTEVFKRKPVSKMPKVTLGVSVNDENLLEVSFQNRDFDFDELIGILQSYRLKRRYHRLRDGSFVSLGDQQLSALAEFVENAGISGADGKKAEIPLAKAMYLDSLAREDSTLRLERDRSFKHLVRDIRSPEESDITVPEELSGVMRDYQVTGFSWLSGLAAHGLGGILADDMGLGKTLQVLAFLLSKKEEGREPSLVVTPTSLMYNWLDEAARFTPGIKAAAIDGTKKERGEKLASADCDLIITTYNMLKRDIELYEKMKFRYCFLDEAQHIKNPTTQNAKAVKRIRAERCFALTGTPIENTLTELWSIFDFLMPGYLGTHKRFHSHFEIPIVRAQDPQASAELRRHIAPFVLRRLKKDVLTELPDKVESRMVCEMTTKQTKVYDAYFAQAQKDFRKELKAHGFDASHIKILALLTRLRQIACDPSLFLENYDGGSGKLDLLEEILQEAVSGGHRVLIFSQFTTMLARIAQRLSFIGLKYYSLDGSTPALTRVSLVKDFNTGNVPVFLISLKAGGTGLNLTGADMVIHYDPWWNPAVEDQATDRAYRIGQEKNVQVIRLVTRGTIEEKIFALQEKKKALIDRMIQPGESFLSKLSEDEILELFR
ncbi:MAG: DEAD/DEAH box helicase [Schwartzia sp.]|nr:DEAD/DEAH box helicase [Schwartzia sp. (in: firmicutes)]